MKLLGISLKSQNAVCVVRSRDVAAEPLAAAVAISPLKKNVDEKDCHQRVHIFSSFDANRNITSSNGIS